MEAKEDPEGDGEDMGTGVTIMDKEYRERLEGEENVPVPRRLYIQKQDLDRLGYTVGCPGCVSVIRGGARQQHTEGCRRSLESELSGTSRAVGAEKRRREILDRASERDERRRELRQKKESGRMEGGRWWERRCWRRKEWWRGVRGW